VSAFAPAGLCANCLIDDGLGVGLDDSDRGCPQPQHASPPEPNAPSTSPPASEPAAGEDTRAPRIRYFGDYELLEEIARGGMGVVYRARQLSLNRIVAVKMILSGEFASPEAVQRFHAEAEAAARLQHPNIVAIHEVGEHEGHQYFSMDYVKGQNLSELVHEHPLPAKRAAAYLKTIAEAIQYAHAQGVLHRDLKPSNILLDAHDQPRVTDFGLAKRLPERGWPQPQQSCQFETHDTVGAAFPSERAAAGDSRAPTDSLTSTGQILGSPYFMPPEQAGGKTRAIGAHSDVYGLGAILYHLLTRRPPFVAETVPEILRRVLEQEPIAPRLLNPAVPRDLETICLRCLNKEPPRRYASAQALADELGRFLRDEPILARPASPLAKAWRWCRRKPVIASLAAGIVVLLLVVAIGLPVASARIDNQKRRADHNAQREMHLWLSNAQLLVNVGKPLDAVASLADALLHWPDQPAIWNATAAARGTGGALGGSQAKLLTKHWPGSKDGCHE
jgi:serine/threonine protein kinase